MSDTPETSARPVNVGIVGAGYISDIYLTNLTNRFDNVRVVAVADLMIERAQAQAAKYGIGAMSVDAMLADPEIELIVNLTIPLAHAEVALAAVRAGKSVYNEKPLTASREDGRRLLDLAQERGVLVGGAPDTFLGGGLQTGRKLIDEGAIGTPIAASAYMFSRGHERWHPDPAFYYQPGAGPMFDMGPYYLTALVSLLGPVRRVGSTTGVSFPERRITSQPKFGEMIEVNTPTHIVAALDFESGAIASVITSFDLYDTTHSTLVVYGSEGTLRLPDPNRFSGAVSLLQGPDAHTRRDPLFQPRAAGEQAGGVGQRPAEPTWEEIPLTHDFTDNSRGLGVTDLARAIREGGSGRANGELAYHVLDIMHATLESSECGEHIMIESSADRPAPLPSR